jgi:hypothetical protein
MLPSHLRLRLPRGLFPLDVPFKTLYPIIFFLIRVTRPSHLILLGRSNYIKLQLLPVALYGCRTWSFILRDSYTSSLRMCEIKLPRKM